MKLVSLKSLFSDYHFELAFLVSWIIFWSWFALEPVNPLADNRLLSGALIAVMLLTGALVFFVHPDRLGNPSFSLSAQEIKPAVVIPEEVKVYSGNSVNFQVIFLLHSGAEILVGQLRDNWVELLLPDGRRGWANANDIFVI